jgi:hypothetical protein
MAEISFVIRTADQTRKAEVSLEDTNTGADVIQGAVDNWSLPKDTDYSLMNTTSSKALLPTASLASQGVASGDVLEVQPVLVAGGSDEFN